MLVNVGGFNSTEYGFRIHASQEDLLICETTIHRLGLEQTRSGYGAKLTTHYKILFNGKLYRVYATCHSNVASHWFTCKKRRIYIS